MFHRFAVPTYFGGLPGSGYDYINTPSLVGGSGVPAQYDGKKSGGPNDGSYFVAFGEDGTSKDANRPAAALANNTDFLDDLFHQDLAIPTFIDKTGIAGTSVSIVTSTDLGGGKVFVGPPGTANNQDGLAPYFRITDPNDDDQVTANPTNSRIYVTSVSPGGAVGTFYSGTLTLTLSAVPPNSNVRIHCGQRSSLYDMGPAGLVLAGVQSSQERQAGLLMFINDLARQGTAAKGTDLVGSATASFTAAQVSAAGAGGIGSVTTLTSALSAIDSALVRRRAFTAVHTDNISSTGGDYNGTSADTLVDGTLNGGVRFLRRGTYEISSSPGAVSNSTKLVGEPYNTTKPIVQLAAARAADLSVTSNFDVENVDMLTASTTARYMFSPSSASRGFKMRGGSFSGGALYWNSSTTGGHFVLEDVIQASNPGFTGAGAGLELTGSGTLDLHRCVMNGASLSAISTVKIHDYVDGNSISGGVIENCYFGSGLADYHASHLQDVDVPITYKNCVFENYSTTSGSGYALYAINCKKLIFENCSFISGNGQIAVAANSGAKFIKCRFSSGNTAGLATNPAIIAYGNNNATDSDGLGSKFQDCELLIGSSSLRGSAGAIQKAVVELGGTGGAPAAGITEVDGLYITFSTSVTLGHNFSTIVLHGYGVGSLMHRNSYKHVTFDARSVDHTGAGTPGGVYTSPTPSLIEIGGSALVNSENCVVEDMLVMNVKGPSSTHDRYIVYAQKATIRNLAIEGSSVAGAGSYSKPLVELNAVECENLYMLRNGNAVACSATSVLRLDNDAHVTHGFFKSASSVDPSTAWVHLYGDYARLDDFTIFKTNATATTAVPLLVGESTGEYQRVTRSNIIVDGDPGINNIVQMNGSEHAFEGNMVRWARTTNSIITSSGDRSSVVANRLLSTSTVPTKTVSGAGTTDSANTLAASASATNPN